MSLRTQVIHKEKKKQQQLYIQTWILALITSLRHRENRIKKMLVNEVSTLIRKDCWSCYRIDNISERERKKYSYRKKISGNYLKNFYGIAINFHYCT